MFKQMEFMFKKSQENSIFYDVTYYFNTFRYFYENSTCNVNITLARKRRHDVQAKSTVMP